MGIVTTLNPLGGNSIDWKRHDINGSYEVIQLYSANGIILAVTYEVLIGDGRLIYSYDGITWNDCITPAGAWLKGEIVWGGDKFVQYGRATGITTDKGLYSYDGVTWNYFYLPNSNYWEGLAYDGHQYIMMIRFPSLIITTNDYAYSTDGINWVKKEMPFQYGYRYKPTATINGYFLLECFSGFDTIIVHSIDGINWAVLFEVNTGYTLNAITSSNSHYYFIGTSSPQAGESGNWYRSEGYNWQILNTDHSSKTWCLNNKFLVFNDNAQSYTGLFGSLSSTYGAIRYLPRDENNSNMTYKDFVYVEHLKQYYTIAYDKPYCATLDA